VDYHFVTTEQFAAMVHAGDFLEYARFAGHWYGTPRVPVEQRLGDGAAALLEIDLQGARQVRGTMPAARLVFLAPPSREELHRRLAGRGTEATPEIAERLALAEVELAAAAEFDVVVINDDVTRAADQLAALIASD
jgi:guanylate kinase